LSETRVLLVEDEPGYARFLREVLAEADGAAAHALAWVGTLEDAVARLGGGAFDIVLLDLGLPDADGTEALERVSAAAPATPIVVLSALNDLDVALESMRLGAQEYLVKGQSEHLLLPRAIRYAIERKRLQEAAAAARAEAERANRAKDEFLAMLGHELRNPLAPIVTALSLMRRHEDPATARELTIVERQVQHVVRLVDDLLDVSRIARGKFELHRGVVDVADMVADGVETASPLFEGRRLALSVDVPRGRLFVDGDRMRLAQVAANLLTNAAKYTDAGGSVDVSARADGGAVELRVRDDGIGMSPDLLVRVFDIFEQGARTIDRAAGGLGLGLAIVKSIVTLHGGEVRAASGGPGKGSEFCVRLPLLPPRERTAAPPRPAAPARAAASRRVLIVDDNEDGALLLDFALSKMGHTTRTAFDGPSALEAAVEFLPDVALLDIGLPAMDGYEVARRLRDLLGERTPALIALTGYGQESDRARSRAAGFDRHLVKPVDLAQFPEIFASLPRKQA
jgi:signal transduction histidine kinase